MRTMDIPTMADCYGEVVHHRRRYQHCADCGVQVAYRPSAPKCMVCSEARTKRVERVHQHERPARPLRAELGTRAAQMAQLISSEPDRWWQSIELGGGNSAASSIYSLWRRGLVERELSGRVGSGGRETFRYRWIGKGLSEVGLGGWVVVKDLKINEGLDDEEGDDESE